MDAISKDLYRQNYGEGFEDLGESMALVKQYTQQTGDELEKITATAIAFRDVFNEDVPESLKAADTMMKKFGITSEQSYNLMAQGAQKGLNKSGELIDTANEYSVYFDKMGYSADEMFNVFAAGMENGAFSLDKVADAVKEFGIRIKDGSEGTNDAIYALFAPENLDEFVNGLVKGGAKSAQYLELVKKEGKETANILLGDFSKGGKTAAKAMKDLQMYLGEGDNIFDGLTEGSMTGKQAMEEVIKKLKEIKDPIYQGQIAVSLFGTQFEDMESDAILALGNTRKQFDMTQQTMEEVAAVKYSTLSQQFATIGRELMTDLVIPLGEDLMPLLQGLAKWMGDNEKLLMVIALGVPAAALAKNTIKIVKSLLAVEGAAGGAGGAAGGFAKVLGMLTNPVGIAIVGVGLLTAGVIAYKKHQEKARQELLNMGDALGEAYSNYTEVDHASKRTQNLITEYDRLTQKIKDSKTPADELTEARRKLKDVEKELIDMNPDILSAEGSKNSKFRDQLDLLKDINQTRADMSKRELEHDALEAQGKMPDLENQYSDLAENLSKQNAAYEKAKVSYRDYLDYMKQYQKISDSGASDEQKTSQWNNLASKIEANTGENYSGPGWVTFRDDLNDIEASFDKYNEKIKKTQDEMAEAEKSFSSYYDLQKRMIELNLGGTLEQQAAKYKDLSYAEKKRFDQAMQDIADLNGAMDMMPDEKKIDLQLIWQQTGQVPDLKTVAGQKLSYLALHDPGIDRYADGGIANQASIFGEAGPEIAIPLNNKSRSRSLLEKANDLMGHTSNGEGSIDVTWAPQITIQGSDPAAEQKLRKVLQDSQADFERKFKVMMQQQKRVSFQ
nr:phage tail tape measure protein [Paenibacillus monticola]